MSTVEQIEAAIQGLPRQEFFRLHEWMRDRFHDEWDRRLEEDVRLGKLDRLGQEALALHRSGKSKAFPPDEK